MARILAMLKIVQKDDPALRQIAADISPKEIKTPKVRKIIRDMKKALASQDDGVAIAAPQIGVPLRIFVVSGKVYDLLKARDGVDTEHEDETFINPTIIKVSKEKHVVEEGCLSVRWLYGKVRRAKKVIIKAYDEHGKQVTRGGSGLFAQIFQHEMDHLDGILFTDKATHIEDIPPDKQGGNN